VDTVVVRDTVVRQVVDTIIQTVQASPCGCENMNAAQKWVRYMELRKEIRKEADPFRKDILVACRLAIGREVRTQHRYDGRLAKEDAPKAKLMSNRGGQKGLAKAKARRFWRSVGKWFKSIGSCRRV
jgi:negative regulator of sigma E activity